MKFPPKPIPISMSKTKHDALTAQQKKLETYREEVLVRLQAAREQGDLSENGAYTSAKFELRTTDRQLRQIRSLLFRAKLVEASPDLSHASLYHSVEVLEAGKLTTYQLVGVTEADPKLNKVSILSPFGKALMGAKVGQDIVVHTPAGNRHLKVTSIG